MFYNNTFSIDFEIIIIQVFLKWFISGKWRKKYSKIFHPLKIGKNSIWRIRMIHIPRILFVRNFIHSKQFTWPYDSFFYIFRLSDLEIAVNRVFIYIQLIAHRDSTLELFVRNGNQTRLIHLSELNSPFAANTNAPDTLKSKIVRRIIILLFTMSTNKMPITRETSSYFDK